MTYISLFAGIGGFDLALNRCGHECVYANEWDKYAAEIYNKNFNADSQENSRGAEKEKGNKKVDREGLYRYERSGVDTQSGQFGKHSNYGKDKRDVGVDTRDIRTVATKEIPDHDILVGGFPCQAFSIAGKRRGFDDTRGTLFFEIARILKDKQPKFFILENVKGLLSHDGGNTFKTIITTLTELGYDLQWQVLNSKNFGVPQNRERVFIIGHIRGQPRPEVFPIGGSNQKYIQEDAQGNDLAHTLQTGDKHRGSYIRTDKQDTQKGGDKSNNTNTIRRTPYSDGMRIRRLTPTECERLQGFPDGWTEGISDTQRYKCLGNAVTTNVITAIAKKLKTED